MRDTLLKFSLVCYYAGRYADITAVYLLLAYQTHQPLLILTLVPFVRAFPHVACAPGMGLLIDRFSSSNYLIYVMLLISGIIFASAFVIEPWILLLLLLLRTILRTGVQPGFIKFFRTHSVIKLAKKNIQKMFIDNLMSVIIPPVIGVLVTITSIHTAFLFSAISYLVAAIIFKIFQCNSPENDPIINSRTGPKIMLKWLDVLKLLLRENRVFFLVLGSIFAGFIVSLLKSVYPLIAYQNHFTEFEYGLIISQYGTGALVILILSYKKLINTRFYKKFYYSLIALSLGMGLIATSIYSGSYLMTNMLCWFFIGIGATLINLLEVVYVSRLFSKNTQATIHSTVNFLTGIPILLIPLIGWVFSPIQNMEILIITSSLLLFGFAVLRIFQRQTVTLRWNNLEVLKKKGDPC